MRRWHIVGMTFHERVLELRKRKKLSQRKFGSLVGLDQAAVSRLENGHIDITVGTLTDITRVLGVSMVGFWQGVS
jgi:transcriptional regulator with XRE-family HTH domain